MKVTNVTGLPEGLVRAIANDPYDAGDSDITASTLADPPLLQALKRAHWDDLEEDASERVWSLLGQAAHVIAERGAEKAELAILSEERRAITVSGWKVSGAIDHLDLSKGILSDYKVTSAWTLVFGDRIHDWTKQLNTLAHIFETPKYQITGLEVIAILRDWSARDLERSSKDYPKAPVVVVPLKLWNPEKRQAYIEERVRLHQNARELVEAGRAAMVTPCTDEERWAKRDKKTGAVTYQRCQKYCAAAKFCPVWASEKLQHQEAANA